MALQILGVSLVALALYFSGRLFRGRSVPLPPGPPGWPLIGNLLDFPTYAPYKAFGAMASRYGPIISLKAMGTRYVILNSSEATKELLEKRSATTSNRPDFTMGNLVGWGASTGFLQYDDTHRKHRKFFHQQIGTKNSLEAFYPAEEAEAKQFARNVLKNPDNLLAHVRRTTASLILKISHGYDVKGDGDPLVEIANRAMHNISVVTKPGGFLVDFLPTLRHLPEWFPGCGFQRDAKRWRKMVREAVDAPYEFVLEQLAKGDATPSFTSRLLQEGAVPEDEEILKWVSFAMYLGGSDTTPSALSAFFLAMIMYPETLKRAQAEIDAIVGNDRLPTMQDREVLPYVNAICRELLRWNVVFPITMHCTTEDETYDGYLFPKGTFLLGNMWFILSNPETYPNPEVFDPQRFLGKNQQPDPREVCFGWGRRRCPGALLAEATIFISVAVSLATLDVSKYVENGVEYVPKYEFEEEVIRCIKPFKCRIVPRSKKAEDLLDA